MWSAAGPVRCSVQRACGDTRDSDGEPQLHQLHLGAQAAGEVSQDQPDQPGAQAQQRRHPAQVHWESAHMFSFVSKTIGNFSFLDAVNCNISKRRVRGGEGELYFQDVSKRS